MTDKTPNREFLHRKWNEGLTWRAFLDYSEKNVEEMKDRYEKTELNEEVASAIKGLKQEVRLLALGADWCGDVVANLPTIARVADLNPKVQLRVLDRDRHEDLMERFLTNGGKAIPKVIVMPASMERVGAWGPRPAECQKIMIENKDKMPKEEIYPKIKAWYEQDKGQTLQKELWETIRRQLDGGE